MSALNQCTYDVTGPCHVLQFYRVCFTCSESQAINVAVCLNCASICHEDHNLGPVTRDSFYCYCFENDVHYCRATRAGQSHIHRRRTQDAKFKALQEQYLRDRTPYPSSASMASHNVSRDYSRQTFLSKNKKFVVWYRTDDQPRAIVKVFDDIDDANDCVKEGFVKYNPWNLSGLELRSLETFQCSFSASGLAQYSVSLTKPNPAQQHHSDANSESVELRSTKFISPIDLAKACVSVVSIDTSAAVTETMSAADSPEEYLVEDHTLTERGKRWEVHAEVLEVFLLEYGWEPASAMPSVTPAQHQLVDWYDFSESDPFMEQETGVSSNGNKHTKDKKKKLPHLLSMQGRKQSGNSHSVEDMADNVCLPLKKGTHNSSSSSGKKKTATQHGAASGGGVFGKHSAKNEYVDDWEDLQPVRKRGRPAAVSTAEKKSRISKEEGAPKGPSSCFMFFSNKFRATIRDQFPDFSVTDLPRYIGEQWHKMSAAEKEPFEEMARQDRARYAREKAAFEEAKQGKVSGLLSPSATENIDSLAATDDISEDEQSHVNHRESAHEMDEDSKGSSDLDESLEHEEQELMEEIEGDESNIIHMPAEEEDVENS